MNEPDWNEIFSGILKRYEELKTHDNARLRSFIQHAVNLPFWEKDGIKYLESQAHFPNSIHVAFAVCQPDCGVTELIVEGSTQECQKCGRIMFRTATMEYSKP